MAIEAPDTIRGADQTEVLIIGAGPAGLSLAAQLRRRRIPFRILDKGSVGESWRRMPPKLKLVSPWKTNWLCGADAPRHARNAQLTRADFVEYLDDYATANGAQVETNSEVETISVVDNEFHVDTTAGRVVCRMVVNATGYFSNPAWPIIPGAKTTTIPQLHYADYSGPEQIRSVTKANPTVLIVGQRLSAGQTMLELCDAGFRTALSCRTVIQFGCSDWLWPVVYRTFALVETMKLSLLGNRTRRLEVRMPGGRMKQLITSGAVPTFPAIERFDGNRVIFKNGEELRPGVVLYATGFRPSIKHLAALHLRICPESGAPLCRDMESIDVPNLFFVGLDMLRNFQSRFLRGIRHDTVALGEIIASRLALSKSATPASHAA